jgi:hypothetical protein
MPFEWIPDQQYSLESRLRQIQSLADRVLAMLDTGVQRDTVLAELDLLREEVIRVRQLVARGGTRAPPPIERLLQLGAEAAGAQAQPAGGRRASRRPPGRAAGARRNRIPRTPEPPALPPPTTSETRTGSVH